MDASSSSQYSSSSTSAERPTEASLGPAVVNLVLQHRLIPADTLTPVSCYLRLRDRHPGAVLLECNDVHAGENRFSFLALDPIASLRVAGGLLEVQTSRGSHAEAAGYRRPLAEQLASFTDAIQVEGDPELLRFSGFFGHTAFDAVQHFETLTLDPDKHLGDVPDMHYRFYRFVLVFDHFRDTLLVLEHAEPDVPKGAEPSGGASDGVASSGADPSGGEPNRVATSGAGSSSSEPNRAAPSGVDVLVEELERSVFPTFPFALSGEESCTTTEEDYLELVEKAKAHCRRGDVFQLVLSRRFSQAYRGDEFAVYRALRSVNPSPYLFFFDFGEYRLFGSSPEAQLVVRGRRAEIHPIAGTYRRSGNDAEDSEAAKRLADDPKENAEHVMLVDLARNDLGRFGRNVEVAAYRELQYFSHVIHLVSRVEADLAEDVHPLQVFGATFPAGTLSGAPKYRAVQLIDQYEPHGRGFYGGAVGVIGLDGGINHAITIRSLLARDGTLQYQAGAGIVVDSEPEKELQEIDHKLGAVRRAMLKAVAQTQRSPVGANATTAKSVS